jgi:hypothetical protein
VELDFYGRWQVPRSAGTGRMDARRSDCDDGTVLRNDIAPSCLDREVLRAMSAGLEPELSVVIDVFDPIDAVTQVATEFRQKYPLTRQ